MIYLQNNDMSNIYNAFSWQYLKDHFKFCMQIETVLIYVIN
jgi:hypothetical protein